MKDCSAYGANTNRPSNNGLSLTNPGTEIVMEDCSAYGAGTYQSRESNSVLYEEVI